MSEAKKQKNKFSIFRVLIPIVFIIIGYFSYPYLHNFRYAINKDIDFETFQRVWSVMEREYPFEQPSEKERIYGAIQGLIRSYGDDYSRFLTEEDLQYFDQNIHGEFGGIGAEIGVRMGFLVVSSSLPDSPAERAGLKTGDVITHIDGVDVSQQTLDSAISKIRGEVGTSVTLTIIRLSEDSNRTPQDIVITREIVKVPIINTEVIDDTFVIHLYNFNDSSEKEFKNALVAFQESGLEQLVLDLRENPGGYLSSVVDMVSYFLPQGYVITKEQTGLESSKEFSYRSIGYDLLQDNDFDMVVLINEGSASASEIFAAALQDYKIATIAGETSFGKGSVQELIEFDNETALKVTIARWLTPNGEHITEGVVPDIIIEDDNNYEEDTQLLQAIELFNKEEL